MLEKITFYPILGIPMLAWGGMVTFLFLIATASVAILTTKGIKNISVSTHVWLARITILLSLIHGTLGILAFI